MICFSLLQSFAQNDKIVENFNAFGRCISISTACGFNFLPVWLALMYDQSVDDNCVSCFDWRRHERIFVVFGMIASGFCGASCMWSNWILKITSGINSFQLFRSDRAKKKRNCAHHSISPRPTFFLNVFRFNADKSDWNVSL